MYHTIIKRGIYVGLIFNLLKNENWIFLFLVFYITKNYSQNAYIETYNKRQWFLYNYVCMLNFYDIHKYYKV